MQREKLETYIVETYHADADYPWAKYPDYEVFRHGSNHKWFALIMDVPKVRLGLSEAGMLSVVNVKCGPVMAAELWSEPGFFPAYHMRKDSWITIALDGSAAEEKIKMLLDMSFDLTNGKSRKRRVSPGE